MRVVVFVGVVADDAARLFEVADDVRIGFEDILAGPLGDVVGESALVIDGHDPADGDIGGLAGHLIVLAEPGGHVDNAGAVAGIHEVSGEDPEGIGSVGEEVEQRGVGTSNQVAARAGPDFGGVLELGGVALGGGCADD